MLHATSEPPQSQTSPAQHAQEGAQQPMGTLPAHFCGHIPLTYSLFCVGHILEPMDTGEAGRYFKEV